MALFKEVTLDNGVTLRYHRIVNISIFTNSSNSISVNSYTTEIKREEEKYAVETGDWSAFDAYIEGRQFVTPYDQFMTIDSAYEYLKTLPEFEGSIDC